MTSKNYAFLAATLRLFNCVLEAPSFSVEDFEVLKDYGMVLSPRAFPHRAEILRYLEENKVSKNQMNHTFYSCPQEVESKSFEERLNDQLLHYFTTYGFEALGIESEFVYVPNDWEKLNVPDLLKLKVIHGVPKDTLISKCLEMLKQGVGLKQSTIEDIFTVLFACDYVFTGSEEVSNREARIFMYDRTGILPTDGEELFRYLVFKATGLTSLVKDKTTLEAIRSSGFALPNLDATQLQSLAKSFNRRKEYWMSFKVANRAKNASIVNTLSKWAKTMHESLKADILGNLTNLGKVPAKALDGAIQSSSVFKLVRAASALELYQAKPDHKFYAVRNGKCYVKGSGAHSFELDYKVKEKLLKSIREKVDQTKKVYIPEGVQYSFPTSEKMFTGEVPNFSTVEVNYKERDLLVGIYWENAGSRVDYDLSMDSLGGMRVGWNSRWSNNDLTYSGDITDGSNGAAEWFVVKSLTDSWQIAANLYSGGGWEGKLPEFTIMVGYGNKLRDSEPGNYRNYFIDPNDVLFSAKVSPTKRQTVLGVLSPVGDTNARFTLINSGNGSKAVSNGSTAVSYLQALLPRAQSTLKLNDFVNVCSDPSEADIDLSPNNLTKDSLLSLLR